METHPSTSRKKKPFFLSFRLLQVLSYIIATLKPIVTAARRLARPHPRIPQVQPPPRARGRSHGQASRIPPLVFLLVLGLPLLSYFTFGSRSSSSSSLSYTPLDIRDDALYIRLLSTGSSPNITARPSANSSHLQSELISPVSSRNVGLVRPVVPNIPSHRQPTIHLVLACDSHEPCCDSKLTYRSLHAALNQTLHPNHVTLLHGCSGRQAHRADSLIHSMAKIVTDTVNHTMFTHECAPASEIDSDMEQCILQYVASPPEHSPAINPASLILVLSSAQILEPNAAESMWLFLLTRPHLAAVHPMPYAASSASESLTTNADIASRELLFPQSNADDESPVSTIPLMFRHNEFLPLIQNEDNANPDDDNQADVAELWIALSHLMAHARIIRLPLYTAANPVNSTKPSMLALRREYLPKYILEPFLWSEHAYYKWSTRLDNAAKYELHLNTRAEKVTFDIASIPFRHVQTRNKMMDSRSPRVMFIMPWMQMGGSEKCMLDIASRFARMGVSISFIFTMPFWYEDPLGELSLKHEWVHKAFALTSDVFDIITLTPNEKFSKVLRYFIETRTPDFVLTANARVMYEQLSFIKEVSPSTMVADYNHMVHMNWMVAAGMGGGMPRYGATYSNNIDLHLTASANVTNSMMSWLDADILEEHPHKVHTCYIGTDPSSLHSDTSKMSVRRKMRNLLNIDMNAIVVLFAGRFVADKGIDVIAKVVRSVAGIDALASKLEFVFVGSGPEKGMLKMTKVELGGRDPRITLQPSAVGLDQLRDYYAMADIFLLPSVNEGIALVLYEAMAAGLLVMSTDVGGQKELIRSDTGVLLPLLEDGNKLAAVIVSHLQDFVKFWRRFDLISKKGRQVARSVFTTNNFCECVISHMIRAKRELEMRNKGTVVEEQAVLELRPVIADVMRVERVHGLWNRQQVVRSMEGQLTVGIKTYVCDTSVLQRVVSLVKSIRMNYPKVRVLLGNDGPMTISSTDGILNDDYTEEVLLPSEAGVSVGRNTLVNMTSTEFFMLLDDTFALNNDTSLEMVLIGLTKYNFDIVGLRVLNMPGFVSKVEKIENRELTLCSWNEEGGPDVNGLRVPFAMDVLHNAFMARTDVLRVHGWRNVLKVNELMTFFLDARKAHVRVGYLPSVAVYRRSSRFSECFNSMRAHGDSHENLLDYKGKYQWDAECGDDLEYMIQKHLLKTAANLL